MHRARRPSYAARQALRNAPAPWLTWTLVVANVAACLAGDLTPMAWDPMALSVSASGAILGVAGAVFANTRAIERIGGDPAKFRQGISIWLAIVFGLGSLLSADDAAHAGGVLMGAAVGWVLSAKDLPRPASHTLATAAALVLLVLGG